MKKLYFFGILALVLFGAVFASCKKDDGEEIIIIDGDTFLENLKSAPVQIASRNTLPGWLVEWLEDFDRHNPIYFWARVYQGEWKGREVYFIQNSFEPNGVGSTYDENGEFLDGDEHIWDDAHPDSFYSTSKNWALIYHVGEPPTKSESTAKITDVYEFPVKQGSAEWTRFESISARIEALQIPDAMLATISTEGLLETCLNFPYLNDILL